MIFLGALAGIRADFDLDFHSMGISSKFARPGLLCLIVALLAFNAFAFLRVFPANSASKDNHAHLEGDYDRTVYRIMDIANFRAEKPFFEVKDHLLFHGRNPALFLFIAELASRAGVKDPLPLQLVAIAMFNIGLVLFFLWVRSLSRSDLVAGSATLFLATTRYLLLHSSTIHAYPYDFLFFNLTIFLFVRYLDSAPSFKKRYLVGTWFGYLIVCSNYWMFYVSTFVMLLALIRVWDIKPPRGTLWRLGLAPASAIAITGLSILYKFGDPSIAYTRVAEIFVARTVDARIDGGAWYPKIRFMTKATWEQYHAVLNDRVDGMFYLGWEFLALAAVCLLVLGVRDRVRILLWAILAGLSWNLLMFQHTAVHEFSGMYGFFAWALIAGYFVLAAQRIAQSGSQASRIGLALVVVGVCTIWLPQLYQTYVPKISAYSAVYLKS
jgi:hypothetical protein